MIISTSLVMFRPFARGPAETRLLSSQTHIGHVLIACHGREWWLKQQAGWFKLWGIWKQKEGYSDMIAAIGERDRGEEEKKVGFSRSTWLPVRGGIYVWGQPCFAFKGSVIDCTVKKQTGLAGRIT